MRTTFETSKNGQGLKSRNDDGAEGQSNRRTPSVSDEIVTKLKVLVERAVRPVRASGSRKGQMREELLAHVTAIFEEEVEQFGDEQIAVERTRQRFGDPRELSTELQRSVPFWDRAQRFLQVQLKSGTWSLPLAATSALLAVIVTLGYFLFTCLIIFIAGEPSDFATTLPAIPANAATSAAFGFLVLPFASRISRALYGSDSERSVPRTLHYCLASLPICPLLLILIYGGLGLLDLTSALLLGSVIAPAIPVLLVVYARGIADLIRLDEEWATLEIEK